MLLEDRDRDWLGKSIRELSEDNILYFNRNLHYLHICIYLNSSKLLRFCLFHCMWILPFYIIFYTYFLAILWFSFSSFINFQANLSFLRHLVMPKVIVSLFLFLPVWLAVVSKPPAPTPVVSFWIFNSRFFFPPIFANVKAI